MGELRREDRPDRRRVLRVRTLGLDLAFATEQRYGDLASDRDRAGRACALGIVGVAGCGAGAFLANAWTGVPLVTVLGITCGNTLEAVVGAYLLRRVAGFRPSLDRVRDVLALVALAAVGGTVIAATIGVASLVVGDEVPVEDFASVWRVWWLGTWGALCSSRRCSWPARPTGLSVALRVARARRSCWPPCGRVEHVRLQAGHEPRLPRLSAFDLGDVALLAARRGCREPCRDDDRRLLHGQRVGPFVRSNPDESLLLAQTYFGVTGFHRAAAGCGHHRAPAGRGDLEQIAGALQESLLPSRLPGSRESSSPLAFDRLAQASAWAVTSTTSSSPAAAAGRLWSAT